jgi:hypothetical protein
MMGQEVQGEHGVRPYANVVGANSMFARRENRWLTHV